MNRKWVPLLLIIVLGIILFFVKRYTGNSAADQGRQVRQDQDLNSKVDRNRGFDRRVSYLEYTVHAKCRMECRNITQSEVEEIMRGGKINYTKSDVKQKPCPTYALEGITHDNQKVRIIFAQCDFTTKVVTSIDLDTDWQCHCPGDDSKHKNRK